ncbi:DUF3318 domain-containing protein [Phormidium sp. CCY1219]|uniref:DUF3318 domain-containing protein n=1 Tax=Phormidium sp. CCY1219 TaxID=2886104 RepID=UPI002D1EF58A|nr:DUF3318 domain-containing protein [Phormidium sp. CCY1219]MEB3828247.1 DUF3318 domain-containing protein [Phormidium sp. CCY1219]
MDPSAETIRLLDLMPASGRMMTKLVSKPQQSTPIESPFPMPWATNRPIYINFDLWRRLSKPQRDMLLLRTVSWVLGVKWFKPDLYQGVAIAGVVGTLVELVQGDAVGILAAGALTSLAGAQIWRITRRTETEVAADEAALQVAQRRGYRETEAASALVQAIEAVAKIERRNLNFSELIRTQNLKAIAGISPIGIPEEGIRE